MNKTDLVRKKDELSTDEALNLIDTKLVSLFNRLNAFLDQNDSENSELSMGQVLQIIYAISGLAKNITSSLYKKKEFQIKEEIDFNHVKIQQAFYFLFDITISSLKESGANEDLINNFVGIMSNRLVGFEDKLNASLKKVSLNMVSQVKNPLVDKMLLHDE